MINLSFRTNKSGDLHATYCGLARIGYVMARENGAVWWTTLIKPAGGCYLGESASVEVAKADIAAAASQWMETAGLEQKKAET